MFGHVCDLLSLPGLRWPNETFENAQALSSMSSRQIFADSQAADSLEQVCKHHSPSITMTSPVLPVLPGPKVPLVLFARNCSI